MTTFIAWLILVGIIALVGQAEINRRTIMATLAELEAAIDAARTELEADKQAILAEIARLGLPDVDVAPLVAKVEAFGTVLDDVPGVTPVPPVEPVS